MRSPLDELKVRRLGLHFIRGGMDRVEYSETANMNQLRLIKLRPIFGSGARILREGHREDFCSPSRQGHGFLMYRETLTCQTRRNSERPFA